MEYPSQGELFEYIVKKKRLSELEASVFFVQIINGIEYMHNKRIAHRDLKPENLIIDKNHVLKIIDFGLSNNYIDFLQTPCGSPCYAAPEMIQGKKYTGVKIDIWSTGIILFAMVCGYLPFEDDDNSILYKKIIECKLEFPFKMNYSCIDMIKRILTTCPEKRINIEEIKRHSFYQLGEKIIKKEMVYVEKNDKVEDVVIEKMEKMGFTRSEIKRDLDNREFSNTTATYYLIYKRMSRETESYSKSHEIVYFKTEPSASCNRIKEDKTKNNKCGINNVEIISSHDNQFPQSNLIKESFKKDLEDQINREKKKIQTDIKTPHTKYKIKLIDINVKNSKNNGNNKLLFSQFEKTPNFKIKYDIFITLGINTLIYVI
jgi:serine/threonine protein kinase